jgi:hypothetical protein
MNGDDEPKSHQLPAPHILSIPAGSALPPSGQLQATSETYDRYFNIARNNPDLLEWSTSCLAVLKTQEATMAESSLTPDDQLRIMRGTAVTLALTLERWLALARTEAGERVDPDRAVDADAHA